MHSSYDLGRFSWTFFVTPCRLPSQRHRTKSGRRRPWQLAEGRESEAVKHAAHD